MNIEMTSILSLSSNDPVDVCIELDGSKWVVKSKSLQKGIQTARVCQLTDFIYHEGLVSYNEFFSLIEFMLKDIFPMRCPHQ
jgi:hypothetical protein